MKVESTLLIYSSQIEVTISGDYVPEEKERGPTYSSGGEPGCPAHVEDITATLNGEVIELDEVDMERAEDELMESVEI